jgi:Na+-transporting methylmalonyl-CoA/oxaloacetate decarboxylase beta subunit
MAHLRRRVVARLDESPRHAAAVAIITGVAAGVVEYVVHTLVMHTVLSRRVPAMVDSAIMSLIAGVLVYMVLAEARTRRRILMQHLRNVAELNHEVRNSLQMIVYSKFLPPQAQAEAILESVQRIENTLRDLFPGEPIPANRKAGGEVLGNKPAVGAAPAQPATNPRSGQGGR